MVNSVHTGSPSSNNQIKSIAIKRENACMYCGLDTPKQKKGRVEHLLKCKDCVNIGKTKFIIDKNGRLNLNECTEPFQLKYLFF